MALKNLAKGIRPLNQEHSRLHIPYLFIGFSDAS